MTEVLETAEAGRPPRDKGDLGLSTLIWSTS